MVSQRNRILNLINYLETLGIDVNLGKNKARGHKGFFMHRNNNARIDISNNLENQEVLSVLLHEFAHYVHYSYDKTLKSLEFIFGDVTDDIREELIKVTVRNIPKKFASSLYNAKSELNCNINQLSELVKQEYPEFKLSEHSKEIEKTLSNPLKYLLKYDKVNYFNKIYSVNNLEEFGLTEVQKAYILIKSKQRCVKRINSKISRLNKYYNNNSELFARLVELYCTNPELTKLIAPTAYEKIKNSNIKYLKEVDNILNI